MLCFIAPPPTFTTSSEACSFQKNAVKPAHASQVHFCIYYFTASGMLCQIYVNFKNVVPWQVNSMAFIFQKYFGVYFNKLKWVLSNKVFCAAKKRTTLSIHQSRRENWFRTCSLGDFALHLYYKLCTNFIKVILTTPPPHYCRNKVFISELLHVSVTSKMGNA